MFAQSIWNSHFVEKLLLCHTLQLRPFSNSCVHYTHTHTLYNVHMYRRCTVCTVRWLTSEPVSRHLYQAWSFHESLKLPSKNPSQRYPYSSRLGWNFYKTCFINSRIVRLLVLLILEALENPDNISSAGHASYFCCCVTCRCIMLFFQCVTHTALFLLMSSPFRVMRHPFSKVSWKIFPCHKFSYVLVF